MSKEHAAADQLEDEDFSVLPRPIYAFDRSGIQAVDRAATEEYGIPSLLLMENAARSVADEILCLEGERGSDEPARPVLILCGKGNNGADGLALARHLHNEGFVVTLGLAFAYSEGVGTEEVQLHLEIVSAMDLPIYEVAEGQPEDALDAILVKMGVDAGAPRIVVDALLGTGLNEPPRGPFARIIKWINGQQAGDDSAVVAVDVPSGLDCDTGLPLGEDAVRADLTVTFVGLKRGFLEEVSQMYLGDLAIGDIGAPVELLARFGRIVTVDEVFDGPLE